MSGKRGRPASVKDSSSTAKVLKAEAVDVENKRVLDTSSPVKTEPTITVIPTPPPTPATKKTASAIVKSENSAAVSKKELEEKTKTFEEESSEEEDDSEEETEEVGDDYHPEDDEDDEDDVGDDDSNSDDSDWSPSMENAFLEDKSKKPRKKKTARKRQAPRQAPSTPARRGSVKTTPMNKSAPVSTGRSFVANRQSNFRNKMPPPPPPPPPRRFGIKVDKSPSGNVGPITIPPTLNFVNFKEQCLLMLDLADAIRQTIGFTEKELKEITPQAPVPMMQKRANANTNRQRAPMNRISTARGGGGGRGGTHITSLVRPIIPSSFQTISTASSSLIEANQLLPVGSKINQPFLGQAPNSVTSSVFKSKSGLQFLPILFVLAPNVDNPLRDAPFDFSLLARLIDQGGGVVVQSLDMQPLGRPNFNCAPTISYTVATSPNDTPEYLFGVAHGTRCIYPTWVLESAAAGRTLDATEYLLPAGFDLSGTAILQHRRRFILSGCKFVVTSTSTLHAQRIAKVLFAAGAEATPVDGISSDLGADAGKVAEASDIVVVEDAPPLPGSAVLRLAQEHKKSLVTLKWLAQSLMTGRVQDPSLNAAYVWNPHGGKVTASTSKIEEESSA